MQDWEEVFCASSSKTVKKILTKFWGLDQWRRRRVTHQQLSFLTLVMSETRVRATIISSLNLTILPHVSADDGNVDLVKIPGFWDFSDFFGRLWLPADWKFFSSRRSLTERAALSRAAAEAAALPLASCVCDFCCCCSCYRLNIWELDWEETSNTNDCVDICSN